MLISGTAELTAVHLVLRLLVACGEN